MKKKLTDLRAVLGAYGVKTNAVRTDKDLVDITKSLFSLPDEVASIETALNLLNCMTKSQRSKLARKNKFVIEGARRLKSQTVQKQREISYQDMVRPLSETDKRQIAEYLPRVRHLHREAVQNKQPWADLYDHEIKMIERGLSTGRM